jgi:signal transduction histidine kinase
MENNLTINDSIHVILHDLREPINNVLTLNELFSEELKLLNINEQLNYQTTVSVCCNKALNLINELLINSQIEDNSQTIKTIPANLNEIVVEQVKLFNIQLINRDVRLHLRLPSKPILTFLDIPKFECCLQNLFTNALKFTPPKGKINISVKRHLDTAKIIVSDTGIGIPENKLCHLFSKFSPASRNGLNGEPSFGLGLFSTKNLVELHGGTISVESKVGFGTKFTIEIPVNEA